jgi:hypothetical protein
VVRPLLRAFSPCRPALSAPAAGSLAALALLLLLAAPSSALPQAVGPGQSAGAFAVKANMDLGPVAFDGGVEPDAQRPRESSASANVCYGFDPETRRRISVDTSGGAIVYFSFLGLAWGEGGLTQPQEVLVPPLVESDALAFLPQVVRVPGTPGLAWGTYEAGYSESDCRGPSSAGSPIGA